MNLFGKDQRPTWTDTMTEELVNKMAKDIFEWCKNSGEHCDLDDCIEACNEIIDALSIHDSGYKLAKEFERKLYIEPDTYFVEMLDSTYYESNKILERYVKEWVKSDDIKPEYSIGTVVRTRVSGEEVEGEIVKVYRDTAQYGVCIGSMGQIKGKSHYLKKLRRMHLYSPRNHLKSHN